MTGESIELQLRNDQVFGLHGCVPEAEVDQVCELLHDLGLEFGRNWTGAERIGEPGKQVILFFDSLAELQDATVEEPVLIRLAPEVIELPPRYTPPFAAVLEAGNPTGDSEFDRPDPLSADFRPEHTPGLIQILTDPELTAASSGSPVVWAPIHALRILGTLKAESAIGPILEELRHIDEGDDDWLGEEACDALANIGPAAVEPTAAYLADEKRGKYARLTAARALAQLARKWPEARAAAVAALTLQLDAHLVQEPEFNGLLISALCDVPAPEAAPGIERAFAAGRVDESIVGDWEDVQIELGLKRFREHPRKPNKLTEIGRRLRAVRGLPEPAEDPLIGDLSPEPLAPPAAPYRATPKVGRNEPCPCGSGKKFKKCCGA